MSANAKHDALLRRIAAAPDKFAAIDGLGAELSREFVEYLNGVTVNLLQSGDAGPALMGNQWAMHAAERLGDTALAADIAFNRGQILMSSGQPNDAVSAYEKALNGYDPRTRPVEYLDCSAALASVLEQTGKRSAVVDVARNALDKVLGAGAELSGEVGRGLIGIGEALRRLDERDVAEECFDAVRQLAEQLGDTTYEAEACAQLAELRAAQDRFDDAVPLYRRSIALNETAGPSPALACDLGNLGFALWRAGQLDAAADAYRKCLDCRARAQFDEGVATDLRHAYHVLHHLGRRDDALQLFRRLDALENPGRWKLFKASAYPVAFDEVGRPLAP